MNESKKFVLPSAGIEVEIGKVAHLANGSVWVRSGNTILLSAACASSDEKEFMGFFPLTVEHRERPASVGRIPGGYFKREGKLTESEILNSRVIDRSVRPLFPHFYFNEVQISSTLLSSDSKFPTDVLAVLGASLALTISDIPFLEPVAAVHAYRVQGIWSFNIDAETARSADCSLIIAGTQGGLCMVEGHANNLSNAEMVDVLMQAHDRIKEMVAWQLEIARQVGKTKRAISTSVDWELWQSHVKAAVPTDKVKGLVGLKNKEEFGARFDECKALTLEALKASHDVSALSPSIVKFLIESEIKELLPRYVYEIGTRFDGRTLDQIRPISCEVGVLPATHGSALFTRGETQAIGTLTLGTGQDAQKIESLAFGAQDQTFMLHYNFPPFSVGEVRPVRAVGRREVGHGHLAEISFKHVLPNQEVFPYTVRSLVDVLASNGSSSMAAVCVTSLALMDAGVPITDAVAGVAMGLVSGGPGKFSVLTDILGSEDAFGLMDLKITGTNKGIMAIQMDVKHKLGLSKDVLQEAFERAEKARAHILGEMSKVMSVSRKQLSSHAPQFVTVTIPSSKIGAVIGTGGKVIKEIMAATESEIDIEDSGLIKVYARSSEKAEKAVQWIKAIVGDLEIGAVFEGTVRRIVDFGIFVELVPGCDGLVHISAIARNKQPDVVKKYKPNDKLMVKVVATDPATGKIRLIAPELE